MTQNKKDQPLKPKSTDLFTVLLLMYEGCDFDTAVALTLMSVVAEVPQPPLYLV